ncbi:dihydrofolate reductase [Acinetobacter phage vB_AbaM_D22]|nr:dihydrofolate reductase [Acinetobacter phage vB_AbaM_D22]
MYLGRKKVKVCHIVAAGLNGEIGKDNKLLCHIPEDLAYFKKMTLGHAVIMGRKTIESLPNKLSRRAVWEATNRNNNGDPLYDGLDSALYAATGSCHFLNTDKIWIAGGASIYKQTEKIVDEVFITRIHHEFPDADTFYNIPEGFVFEGYTERTLEHFPEERFIGGELNLETWKVTFEKWIRVDKVKNK